MKMAKWKQYLEEALEPNNFYSYTRDTYRLAAIGGDVSATGMSNTATIKKISKDDFERVDTYIQFDRRYQEFTREYVKKLCKRKVSDKDFEIGQEIQQLETDLLENLDDIFLSKWEVRSTWAWLETPEFDRKKYETWLDLQEETA